jgi:hypothetical protein
VNGGEIYLVSRRTGLTETLSGDDLAGLLVNNNIQMAVFNSCLGTYAATRNNDNAEAGERNLTETLVKRGVRGVLAMSERIPDEVALTLTQLFYRNLSQGYPVDLCVSRMRQGLISAYGSHQMYWALPILYLQREFDGYLCPEMYLPQTGDLFDEYDPQLTSNSLIYSQTSNDSELALPLEAMSGENFAPNTSEWDWLREDGWNNLDLTDDKEYDDSSYAEDSAIISDLFRQLDQQSVPGEEPPMTGELTHLQDRHISESLATGNGDDGSWGEWQNYNRQSPPQLPGTTGGNETVIQGEPASSSHSVRGVAENPQPTPKTNRRRKLIPSLKGGQKSIIGAVGAGAIATVLGLGWWWQNQQPNLPDIPPIPSSSTSTANQPTINLKTSATGIVTAYATEKLSQGDLPSGLEAVEELLNRNALQNAHTALKIVNPEPADNPSFDFLWGRLIWQLIQTKDQTYRIDDARRYWEKAVKAEPDSVLYSTALGFAYYAEGNANRANDSWFKAVSAASKNNGAANNSPKAVVTKEEMTPNPLTAYAGLAIGMYKSAHDQSANKQELYLNEAIKLRQMVLKEDPANFQLNELAKNWLWSEDAIRDWKSLLRQKGNGQ